LFGRRLVLIAAAAFAVRVLYGFAIAADLPLPGDAFLYRILGFELAHGDGYSVPSSVVAGGPQPTAEHPPLFALYLALWSKAGLGGLGAERVACALLGTATVSLTGVLGRRAAGDRAGLLAAGIAAIYPPLFMVDGALISESLYAPIVVLAMVLAFRLIDNPGVGAAAALGAVVGLAALTRSDGVLLLPLLALPLAWRLRPDRWRLMAACFAATVVVMAPWLGRNWIEFDRFPLLSTNSGFTARTANCPATYYSGEIGFVNHRCALRSDCVELADELARSECFGRRAREYAGDHLSRVPLVVLARVGRLWEVYGTGANLDYGANWARPRWVATIGLVFYLVLLPFALAGLLALRSRRVPLLPLLAPLALVTVVAALTFGVSRYRLAAEPALVVLASVGVLCATAVLRVRRQPAKPQPNQVVEHPHGVPDSAHS